MTNKKKFSEIKKYLYQYWGEILNIIVASILVTVIGMNWPYLYKVIVDQVFIKKSVEMGYIIIIIYIIMFIVEKSMQFLWRCSDAILATSFLDGLRKKIYSKLFQMIGNEKDNISTGEIIDIIDNDTQNIYNLVTIDGIHTITSALRFCLSIAYISYMNRILGMIVLVMIPTVYYLTKYMNKKIIPISNSYKKQTDSYHIWITDVLAGIKTVRFLQAGAYYGKQISQKLEDLSFLQISNDIEINILNNGVYFLNMFCDFCIYGVSAYMINKNLMKIGDFVAIMVYYNWAKAFFERMGVFFVNKDKNFLSVDRITKFLNLKSEGNGNDAFSNGDIVFENINFSYGGKYILKDFNIQLEKGKWIALTGESGCGKSTVLNLLSQLYEFDEGSVFIDGQDIKNIEKGDLRNNVSVIRQVPSIFNKSIRFNLEIGKGKMNEETLWEALAIVEMDEIVQQFPNKLDEIVGDNNLSQGQEQRLSLARAILHAKSIIVLDEATSNIEYSLETKIIRKMRSKLTNITLLVVAYRKNLLQEVDYIYYIKNGKVYAEGNHIKLFANCKEYRELIKNS